jgi:hypothetical protein
MRDDHVVPNDGEKAERGNTANGPRRIADDDGAPADREEDSPSDAPATLSATSHPADVEEAGLSDEEILMYRRRVADGLYNSREVADEVARRMMKRGDI